MKVLNIDFGQTLSKIESMLQTLESGAQTALGEISVRSREPFMILISTILSQRTRDEKTSEATKKLFRDYKDPHQLARAPVKNIERLIRSVGFYRVKAKRIKKLSRILLQKYRGQVPSQLEDLLNLPSVGRKTANCVLVYGFGQPAIPVDTHVHRISNRIGIVSTNNPDETERQLMRQVDRKHWLVLNEILVRFGQKICRPRNPLCFKCSLASDCRYFLEGGKSDRSIKARSQKYAPLD